MIKQMKLQATPDDSRYIPFTQQASCCVPTCFQMIMYKNGIPLLPAEEIGYHLGLIVRPERAGLFYKVRTSEEKPPAGYGTRIYLPEFEPNTAFKNLDIPLRLKIKPISEIGDSEKLINTLSEIEANNTDALLCFNHGVLVDDREKDWGHVVVFDRVVGDKIRIIDPSPEHPKWRLVSVDKIFEAMNRHGEKRSGGVWLIDTVD
ncbi:MAG: hypothetical protein U5L95_02940 [Candidatus Saccharibacteria bacterium]|nr:hypothetical protein [Candidatus Saccharibacteria bacterium]